MRVPLAGITAYVGANGSGKTAFAVDQAIRRARATGRDLWSTVDIDWTDKKGRTVKSRPITAWSDLLGIEYADILADEVGAIASSRESLGLPPAINNLLGSLRHHDLTFSWTAPSWNRADKQLREVTQVICAMRPLIAFAHRGRAWSRTYVAFAGVYDALGTSAGDFPEGRPKKIGIVPVSRLLSIGAYDSWANVPHISEHSVICPQCGKHRRKEFCKGNHPVPEPEPIEPEETPDPPDSPDTPDSDEPVTVEPRVEAEPSAADPP